MKLYVPIYTTQKQSSLNLLLRKLAPLERHYYHSEQYLYDGTYFWLILDSSGDKQKIERNSIILKKVRKNILNQKTREGLQKGEYVTCDCFQTMVEEAKEKLSVDNVPPKLAYPVSQVLGSSTLPYYLKLSVVN